MSHRPTARPECQINNVERLQLPPCSQAGLFTTTKINLMSLWGKITGICFKNIFYWDSAGIYLQEKEVTISGENCEDIIDKRLI